MIVRFLLVCEGPSDTSLVSHIRKLILHRGMPNPIGGFWYKTGSLEGKVRDGLQYFGECDLLLVHRDADSETESESAGPAKRHQEISDAVRDSGFHGLWVEIVPVQTTEAWLLLDETAIRNVTGNPNGTVPLGLPIQTQVEGEANPKARLEQALLTASELGGRRRKRFHRDIPSMHRLLLEELPIGGLLEQVPSWIRFRNDLMTALDSLSA